MNYAYVYVVICVNVNAGVLNVDINIFVIHKNKTILYNKMSRLNRRGYNIIKTDYSGEKIDQIREKLTVKPFVVDDFGNGKNRSFKLYLESENKIYMPRFYGIDVFGEPGNTAVTSIYVRELCRLHRDGTVSMSREDRAQLLEDAIRKLSALRRNVLGNNNLKIPIKIITPIRFAIINP